MQAIKFTPVESNLGYGWLIGYPRITEQDSIFFQRQTGGTNGFTSIGNRFPTEDDYILVLCNTRPGEIHPIGNYIIRIFYGHKPLFRPSSPIKAARLHKIQSKEASLNFLKATLACVNEDQDNEDEMQLEPIREHRYKTRLSDFLWVGNDFLSLERNEVAITFLRLATVKFST